FNDIPNSSVETLDELYYTASHLWQLLLKPEKTFNINLQITDLPDGQLAESTIISFDDSGNPNGGTIFIDSDANSKGWFIDETPLDNSEFSNSRGAEKQRGRGENYFLADSDSVASGKYDFQGKPVSIASATTLQRLYSIPLSLSNLIKNSSND
ncbi:MAG: hypothetical protein ACRC11_23110, partial [Xenococcaceae cyanobacterium]